MLRFFFYVSLCMFIAQSAQAGTDAQYYGPFPSTTYEAEAQGTNGQVVRRNASSQSEADEASGGADVALTHSNDYVEVKANQPGQGLIIRFFAKDWRGNPGQGVLRVEVGGKQVLVNVSSEFCCVFGSRARGDLWAPSSKDPDNADSEWRYWDELKVTLPSSVQVGGSVKVYPNIDRGLAYLAIDTIELVGLSEPLKKPEGYLNIKDPKYGAVGNGVADDTGAIERAVLDAEHSPAKGIWLPPGDYAQTHPIDVKGVSVAGSGAWFSTLHGVGESKAWAGVSGFFISGDNLSIHDLGISGNAHLRGLSGNGIAGGGNNVVLQNLWIQHTGTGFWIGADHPLNNISVLHNKVSSTSADGININRNVHNARVEWNFIRGTGDDGLANFSSINNKNDQMNGNNEFSHNFVVAPYFANGIGLYGGDSVSVHDNFVVDTNRGSGILVSGGFTQSGGQNNEVTHNTIIRGGGVQWGAKYSAIRVEAGKQCIRQLRVFDNRIIAPKFSPIDVLDKHQGLDCFSPTVQNNNVTDR